MSFYILYPKLKGSTEKDRKITKVYDYDSWEYNPKHADWFSEQTGDVFANFQINVKLQNLITNNIDIQL